MSEYANLTMDHLVITAAGERNAANASLDYAAMTQLMYENYTNVWLVIPTQFSVTGVLLQGISQNSEGAANPFQFEYNQGYVT